MIARGILTGFVVLTMGAGLAAAVNTAPTSLGIVAGASGPIDEVGDLISGSWKTTSPVAQGDEEGASTNVVMNIAPVTIEGMDNTFYVELAREDAQHRPYRTTIFQLYQYKKNVRLRTYEFRQAGANGALTGLWLAPEAFPAVTRDDLIATLDVELAKKGKGYSGSTPYPYPTGVGGAVEMTSEVELSGNSFITIDRGLRADGTVVWGSDKGSQYVFERFKPSITVEKRDDGLVILEYAKGEGEGIQERDQVAVEYGGWIGNGTQFDTSRQEGRRPLEFQFRVRSLIQGFDDGVDGMALGAIRRIVIPAALGYGERASGSIPANSMLFFEVECVSIQSPDEEGETETTTEGGESTTGHEGHDHD